MVATGEGKGPASPPSPVDHQRSALLAQLAIMENDPGGDPSGIVGLIREQRWVTQMGLDLHGAFTKAGLIAEVRARLLCGTLEPMPNSKEFTPERGEGAMLPVPVLQNCNLPPLKTATCPPIPKAFPKRYSARLNAPGSLI